MPKLVRRTRRAPAPAVFAVALSALVLAACGEDPVAWDRTGERRLGLPASPDGLAPDQIADALAQATVRALLDTTTAVAAAAAATAATAGTGPALLQAGGRVDTTAIAVPGAPGGSLAATVPGAIAAAAPGLCPTSVRVAAGRGGERVVAWWSERPDQSAALWAARSTDGGRTWDRPAPVDTLDRSHDGCERPAPSVAVDTINGYVHVAFSLTAPEGKGVFYAHRMDPRAAFEIPQVIVYGDRPAHTAVASEGDRVVVAYEDPNTGGRPFVSLALSRTGGHTWDERFAASEGGSMAAERPVVAVRGPRVALAWVERNAPRELVGTDDPRTATAAVPNGVVARVGRFR